VGVTRVRAATRVRAIDHPALQRFSFIWLIDTEFTSRDGCRAEPICISAKELRSEVYVDLWIDELGARPPYHLDDESLIISYVTPAEFSFHLSWGWPLPKWTIDLYTEYKALRNGLKEHENKHSFLDALDFYKIPNIGAAAKDSEQDPAIRGAPFTEDERQALQRYCRSDVDGLEQLFEAMWPEINLTLALSRGVDSKVAALIEYEGTPIDTDLLGLLIPYRPKLVLGLISAVDSAFGVYDGLAFRRKAFIRLLEDQKITDWPSKNGIPLLDQKTFERMGPRYPEIIPLGRLRYTVSKIRSLKLAVGPDGRNRTAVMLYGTTTARNAPSTTKFIFAVSKWLRGLIKPPEGCAIITADWSGQDFGSIAALSQDPLLIEDYLGGDPYKNQARRLGWIPADVSEESIQPLRDRFKISALSIFYGLQARSLSEQMGITPERAGELLTLHRETYQKYWGWSDGRLLRAKREGVMRTSFGWHRQLEPREIQSNYNDFSLRNYPIQAIGAHMIHIMAQMATEKGFCICALIHDAVCVVVPIEEADQAAIRIRDLMITSSAVALKGFKLRSKVKVIKFPDRYPLESEEDQKMFEWVKTELENLLLDRVALNEGEPSEGVGDLSL